MKEAPKVSYKVISTVMVSLEMDQPAGVGKMQIHGSSSKTSSDTVNMPDNNATDPDMFHIENIGRLIEANEDAMRMQVQDVYVSKQRQITNTGRLMEEYMTDNEKAHFQSLAAKGKLLGDAAQARGDVEVFR